MKNFTLTICYKYEYISEYDAILHKENIENDFVLKDFYKTQNNTWVYEYVKVIVK